MSYSFYIQAYQPPNPQQLVAAVTSNDLRCQELPDPWPEGYVIHLHREGRSTRGVELCWESDKFQVRLVTLTGPEDWDLAFRILEHVGAELDSEVSSEDGASCPAQSVRAAFAGLCDEANRGGTQFLSEKITAGEGPLMLPGPIRPFWIGARLLNELSGSGPTESLHERVLARIRAVQFVDEESGYYFANVMEARVGDDQSFTMAACAPGVAYLMPAVDFFALVVEGAEEPQFITYEAMTGLLADWIAYLDERQFFLPPLASENWERFLAQTEALAIDPEAVVLGEVDVSLQGPLIVAGQAALLDALDPVDPHDPIIALEGLDRAIGSLEELAAGGEADVRVDLANAHMERGALRTEVGDLEGALVDHDLGVSMLARLSRRNPEVRPMLASARGQRATLLSHLDRPGDALRDLDLAISYYERPEVEVPPHVRGTLVSAYALRAQLFKVRGDDDLALSTLAQASQVIALASEREAPRLEATVFQARAALLREDDPDAADEAAREASRQLCLALQHDPDLVEALIDWVLPLAEQLDAERQTREALVEVLNATEALLQLDAEDQREARFPLALLWVTAASYHGHLGELESGLSACRQAVRLLEVLVGEGEAPGDLLAGAQEAEGVLELDLRGDVPAALAAYERALATHAAHPREVEPSFDDDEEPEGLDDGRVSVLTNRGYAFLKGRDPDRALEDCREAEQLAQEPTTRALLARNRAMAHLLRGELEPAQSACEQALELLEELGEEDAWSEGFRAEVLRTHGALALASGDLEAARLACDEAAELHADQVASGHEQSAMDLALSRVVQARVWIAQGEGAAALLPLQEARERAEGWLAAGWHTEPELAEIHRRLAEATPREALAHFERAQELLLVRVAQNRPDLLADLFGLVEARLRTPSDARAALESAAEIAEAALLNTEPTSLTRRAWGDLLAASKGAFDGLAAVTRLEARLGRRRTREG